MGDSIARHRGDAPVVRLDRAHHVYRGDGGRQSAVPRASATMIRTLGCATLVCIAAVWSTAPALAQDTQPPMLRAGTLPENLAVDGMLNEPAWKTAETIDAFTQTDPAEGAM